ncbi:hypothetical protein [uncultured Phenylobacterium sp.]|uniref:hypothetical protein n=1 Tax=uncultured Phenylobacterium sp. TaxID=349273 RepID=UPI0025EE151A|nr:hypothetical protein [uncultured Phenylobacterium sp.]
MALYTFHLCDEHGFSGCFETRELPYDSAAYPMAGELLNQHLSADHVEVWEGERPVLSRHREGPVIRPVNEDRPPARGIQAAS